MQDQFTKPNKMNSDNRYLILFYNYIMAINKQMQQYQTYGFSIFCTIHAHLIGRLIPPFLANDFVFIPILKCHRKQPIMFQNLLSIGSNEPFWVSTCVR